MYKTRQEVKVKVKRKVKTEYNFATNYFRNNYTKTN